MKKTPDKDGTMWSRPEAGRLTDSADGRELPGHACPGHSRRPHIPAGGAASSPHTRRRGSHISNVNREASFVQRTDRMEAGLPGMRWSARGNDGQ